MSTLSRTRTRGGFTPTSCTIAYKGYGLNTTEGEVLIPNVGYSSALQDVFHDRVNRPFVKTSDPRKQVNNPAIRYSMIAEAASNVAYSQTIPDVSGSGLNRVFSGDTIGYIFGTMYPYGSFIDYTFIDSLFDEEALLSLCQMDALNGINRSSASSLVSLAELGKTKQLILDRTRKLVKAARFAEQGDIRSLDKMFPGKRTRRLPKKIVVWDDTGSPVVRKNGKLVVRYAHTVLNNKSKAVLQPAARLYLEYRYGWRILVYEIIDTLKAAYAAQLKDERTPREYLTVRRTRRLVSTQVVESAKPAQSGTFILKTTVSHEADVSAFCKYVVTSGNHSLAQRMNDFGVFDIPRSLWDVVPLSFLADQLVPISSWLGALTPKVGVEILQSGANITAEKRRERKVVSYTANSPTSGSSTSPIGTGHSDMLTMRKFERRVGLRVPTFPPIDVKAGIAFWTDVAAILKSGARPSSRT